MVTASFSPERILRWWLLGLVLVAGGTLALGRFVERYESDPTLGLPATTLTDAALGQGGWVSEGDPTLAGLDGTALVLRAGASGIALRRSIPLEAGGPRVLRLSAVAAGSAIKGGERGWRKGRILLVPASELGRSRLTAQFELLGLRGTHAPRRFERVFRVGAEERAIELSIQLRTAAGQLRVEALGLEGLRERPLFFAGAMGLLAAWAVLLATGLVLLLRGAQNRRAAWLLGAGATLGGVLLLIPWELRERLLKAASLGEVTPERAAEVGHFLIFLSVGALVRLTRPRASLPVMLAALAVLGGLTEIAQILIDGRAPALDDWAVNAAGALLGCLLACLPVRRLLPARS